MDGRVNPRIKSGDGQDGRGSEASRRQPTHSDRQEQKSIVLEAPSSDRVRGRGPGWGQLARSARERRLQRLERGPQPLRFDGLEA